MGDPSPDVQVTSFHLPDTFAGLNEAIPDRDPFTSVYPLEVIRHELDSGTGAEFDFDLRASTARYFVFDSDGPHGAVDVVLTSLGGGRVPASVRPQIVVQRTR